MMLSDDDLISTARRQKSDLAAILLLHRWGIPQDDSVRNVKEWERKHKTEWVPFFTRVFEMVEVIQNAREHDKAPILKRQLRKKIDEYLQTNACYGCRPEHPSVSKTRVSKTRRDSGDRDRQDGDEPESETDPE